jgi:hypothetical protein
MIELEGNIKKNLKKCEYFVITGTDSVGLQHSAVAFLLAMFPLPEG